MLSPEKVIVMPGTEIHLMEEWHKQSNDFFPEFDIDFRIGSANILSAQRVMKSVSR
jgi:hypothetical protein